MEYASVAQARRMPGLRLVLSAHVPGPWSEAAKAVLRARKVDFVPVEQTAGGSNEDLRAWTGGIRNAPIAMLDDEPPVHGWLDIVMLAERLGRGESLLPSASVERAAALGISAELCAPHGFGWTRRLLMYASSYGESDLGAAPAHVRAMLDQYGYTRSAVAAASARIVDILTMLADRLRNQRVRGSRYFAGDRISMADYHWACFSQMVAPLPLAEQPAMPARLVEKYSDIDQAIRNALDPILIEHRDHVYQRFIGLPLEF